MLRVPIALSEEYGWRSGVDQVRLTGLPKCGLIYFPISDNLLRRLKLLQTLDDAVRPEQVAAALHVEMLGIETSERPSDDDGSPDRPETAAIGREDEAPAADLTLELVRLRHELDRHKAQMWDVGPVQFLGQSM